MSVLYLNWFETVSSWFWKLFISILPMLERRKQSLPIYKFGLSVWVSWCLFVCLYPINVKTAEPIGPKFFVGHHVTTGKVYEWSKFQIFVSIKIRLSLNFWKFWKSTKFFVKTRELFLFCFTMFTKRTCSQLI